MDFSGNGFFVSNIKGIRIDDILRAALDHLPEECSDSIKYMIFDPEKGEKDNLVVYVPQQSISGVGIVIFTARKGPKMMITLPWFASGVDVCLMFAILRVIRTMYPDAVINPCHPDGSYDDETADLSKEACEEEYVKRLHCIGMLLQTGEKNVVLDTINGEWTMDIAAFNHELKDRPLEDKIMAVLSEVIEYLWFSEDQVCAEEPLPETLADAFRYLDDNLSDDSKAGFAVQTVEEFTTDQHFGLGLYLRNIWFYQLSHEEISPLFGDDAMPSMLKELQALGDYVFPTADEVSAAFLEQYHRHLCDECNKDASESHLKI